jgi:hypothetical protein
VYSGFIVLAYVPRVQQRQFGSPTSSTYAASLYTPPRSVSMHEPPIVCLKFETLGFIRLVVNVNLGLPFCFRCRTVITESSGC